MSEKILNELRRAILASDLNPRQVSLKAKVAPSAVCRLLSGKQGVSVGTAERLAIALGLELVIKPSGTGRRAKGSK